MEDPVHLHLPSLAAWPEPPPLTSKRFQLFLAMDARRIDDGVLLAFARMIVKQGLALASVWGPDCERVHDRIDDAVIEARPEEDPESVILTTGHDRETLEEALEFFVETLEPAKDLAFSCGSKLAVSVGDESLALRIRNKLAG